MENRKHLADLDNISNKIEHQVNTAVYHPKTMSGLTSRNSKMIASQIRPIAANSIYPLDDRSKEGSILWTISNDSNDAVGHSTTNTELKQIRR